MKHHRRSFGRTVLASGAATIIAGVARAQSWPSRPIRLIVPFATGGGSDFIGRFMAQRLGQSLGQPVVVENRPGAGSTLGIEMVVKSPADGHTFGLIASSYTVTPSLYKLRFDPVADITPVIQFSQGPMLVVVPKALPVNSFADLLALARAKPGALNYASAGQGSITHLACALFADMAGVQMTHIPYKGSAPSMTALASGEVDFSFNNIPSSQPLMTPGRIRALAITSVKRSPLLPELPTVAELGYPGFETSQWYGLLAPAGTPPAIIERLQQESRRALAAPAVVERFANDNAVAGGEPPAEFAAFIRNEQKIWGDIVRRANIRAD